jgi:hypothetical protein
MRNIGSVWPAGVTTSSPRLDRLPCPFPMSRDPASADINDTSSHSYHLRFFSHSVNHHVADPNIWKNCEMGSEQVVRTPSFRVRCVKLYVDLFCLFFSQPSFKVSTVTQTSIHTHSGRIENIPGQGCTNRAMAKVDRSHNTALGSHLSQFTCLTDLTMY